MSAREFLQLLWKKYVTNIASSSRFMAFLGMHNFSKLDFGLPANEVDSDLSEYTEVKKQLDKTKKRVKTLVNVIEAQNTLLRRLARKIDPDAELDARSLDQISPSIAEEQATLAPDFFDGQPPEDTAQETKPHITVC